MDNDIKRKEEERAEFMSFYMHATSCCKYAHTMIRLSPEHVEELKKEFPDFIFEPSIAGCTSITYFSH